MAKYYADVAVTHVTTHRVMFVHDSDDPEEAREWLVDAISFYPVEDLDERYDSVAKVFEVSDYPEWITDEVVDFGPAVDLEG